MVVVVVVAVMSGSQGIVEDMVMTELVIHINDSYAHCMNDSDSTGDISALVDSGSGHDVDGNHQNYY